MPCLWLNAVHLAAAMTFVGGVLAAALLLFLLTGRAALAEGTHAAQAVRAWQQRVTTPAMLLVWALGLALALRGGWFSFGWLRAKLLFVLVLSGLHGIQSGALRRLAGGAPTRARIADEYLAGHWACRWNRGPRRHQAILTARQRVRPDEDAKLTAIRHLVAEPEEGVYGSPLRAALRGSAAWKAGNRESPAGSRVLPCSAWAWSSRAARPSMSSPVP